MVQFFAPVGQSFSSVLGGRVRIAASVSYQGPGARLRLNMIIPPGLVTTTPQPVRTTIPPSPTAKTVRIPDTGHIESIVLSGVAPGTYTFSASLWQEMPDGTEINRGIGTHVVTITLAPAPAPAPGPGPGPARFSAIGLPVVS